MSSHMSSHRFSPRPVIWLALVLSLWAGTTIGAEPSVTVFAASSTQPVIDALIPLMKNKNITVQAVYASSATLARQIANGAPADVYVTANQKWMQDLTKRLLVEAKTIRNVATNRLALIAGQSVTGILQKTAIADALNAEALNNGRLAIADPDSVPAGQYAKEALIHTGQWNALKNHLAIAKDVTAALMFVAREETRLGIVYASDLTRTKNVKKIRLFNPDSHSPILYQAVILKNHMSPASQTFLNLLTQPSGQSAFLKAGFGAMPK